MAVSLPDGTIFSIATSYAAAKPMTALSNANPAVATASGIAQGDVMIIQSGWSKINDRVVKIGSSNELLGLDTTDTDLYPAGSGKGSLTKVNSWVQISQVLTSESSGGEQQFATYSFLEDDFERQIPTRNSPTTLTLTIADDMSLAGYKELEKAADSRTAKVVKARLPSGAEIYYNAYVSLNQTPSMTKGEVMAVTATISLVARPMRYAKV